MHIKHVIDFEGISILAHVFDLLPRITLYEKHEKGVYIFFESNRVEITQNGSKITPKNARAESFLTINWSDKEFEQVVEILRQRNLLLEDGVENQIRIACIPQIAFVRPKKASRDFKSQSI